MPGFVFNESTTTFFATDTGTVAAGLLVATVPNYLVTTSTATYIYISNIGVSNNNAATVLITSANAPEISTATTIKRVNSIFINSSLSITGNETTEPIQVYTRDATVNYGKTQWIIPEPINQIRGQPITTSTVVIGAVVTSTYVRSTATGSINAFRITPTTLIKNNYIPVTIDVGGVGFIGTVTQLSISPNIYGVAVASANSWVFAIEKLPSSQTSGLSVNSIITVNTSSNSTGNFGTGNTAYVYQINLNNIIVVATSGTTAPINGTIDGITPIGQTFPSIVPLVVTYLIVGGGGGGGGRHGGGGGAGGYLAGTGITLASGTYPIIVGVGGVGAQTDVAGGDGGPSSAFGISTIGGGGGGTYAGGGYTAGRAGGSGGGAGHAPSGIGAGTAGQGYNGGSGNGNEGGGGGGAGAVGGNAASEVAGIGGVGVQNSITGANLYWAGGGGGGIWSAGGGDRGGHGGLGGGGGGGYGDGTTPGAGGGSALNAGQPGVGGTSGAVSGGHAGANTGGGGGGGGQREYQSYSGVGGNGGSGIVVIRYPGSQRATGGTVTTVGTDTVHAFTSTGTTMLTAGGITLPTFREPVQNPWTFDITGTSVVGFTTGSILSSTPRIGTFGTNNEVYVAGVNTSTSAINCFAWAKGPNSAPPLAGLINAIYPTGELTIPNPIISGITSIGGSAWTFTISNIRGTLNYSTGIIFTATSIIGSLGTGSTVAVISIDSFTQITAYASSGTTPVAGSIGIPVLSQSTAPVFGDNEFVTPGTYTWTAPSGVTSVSVVAIGGGGAGYNSWANAGGAGGGLGWKNNISVTPGNSYTVQVGAGGIKNGLAGGNSYFISLATVSGYGGGNATANTNTGGPNANGYGGGYVGDGGGAGGNATNYTGGGGAGGYSGTGGNQGALPAASSGGAAGGGYYSSTYGSGAGGGVGIYGKGDTATGWYHGSSGQVFSTSQGNGGGGAGGSGGTRGLSGENPTNSVGESGNIDGYGGTFGGGGGGPGTSWPSASGSGGKGGVRIIWGTGRAFPSTQTASMSTVSVIPVPTTRSKNIGGPTDSYKTAVSINRMPYPESISIDRLDTLVIVNTINTATTKVRIYANQGTNTYGSGSKSTTDSLTGSTDFYVAGTGTGTISSGTTITRYWI